MLEKSIKNYRNEGFIYFTSRDVIQYILKNYGVKFSKNTIIKAFR